MSIAHLRNPNETFGSVESNLGYSALRRGDMMQVCVACFGTLEGLRRSTSLISGSENVLQRSAEIKRAFSKGWATLALRGCAQKTGADISYVVTMDILMHTQLSFAILARAMMLGKSFDGGSLSNLPHTLPSLPDVALVADLYPCAAL